MESEESILSDKKLQTFMSGESINKMAELFSNGKFNDIINIYFKRPKIQKNETINIQTIQQFFGENNNNKNNVQKNDINNNNNNIINNPTSFNKSDNHLIMAKDQDFNTDFTDDTNISKTFTYNVRGNNFEGLDYVLNTPPNHPNNNLINANSDNKINNEAHHEYMKPLTNNIIDDYYNKTTDEYEYNYSLLDQCENDKLTQQIILTIVAYCLLKIKEDSELKSLFANIKIPKDKLIFPLILLKAKFYFKIKAIGQSMDILTEAINNYDNFKLNYDNNDMNHNDIIYIETYNQDFAYFNNLFNYLFALNNIDSKIKKLYYEQKFILFYLNFYQQGYKLLIELHNKYPKDVQIQFELAKDSVFLSKFDVFSKMFEIIKKNMEEENNENKKQMYTNYLLYLQGLSYLAQGKIDETGNYFKEILKNDTSNIVIINNSAVLSMYKNKAKNSFDYLKLIDSPDQMDSSNDCIKENIHILSNKFNAELQK